MKSTAPAAAGSPPNPNFFASWRGRVLRLTVRLASHVWQCLLLGTMLLAIVMPTVWVYRWTTADRGGKGLPESKQAGTYLERGFSVESGPEVVSALDRARVVVLKHRESGRRFAVVLKGESLAMEEIR